MENKTLFLLLYFLILFDFIFFNIDIGFINITALRMVIFLLVIYYLLSHLTHKKLQMNKEIKVVFIFLFCWLFYMFVSLSWAVNTGDVYKGIYYFILYLMLIYLIVKLLNKREYLMFMETTIYYSIVIISFLGLFEYFTGIRMEPSRYNTQEFINVLEKFNKNAVTGMFGNENNYSFFLALYLPFILIGLIKKNKTKFLLSIITIMVIVFLVVMNQAKLITIMIFVELIIFIVMINLSKIKKVSLFIIVFLMSFIVILIEGSSFVNFSTINKQLDAQSGSSFIRLNLLKNTKYVLNETNYLGTGISNYGYYMNPELFFGHITNPHNWWVELLTESGVIIFIGFIIIYITISIKLFRAYNNNKENDRYIYLALFIGSIGFIIGSISPSLVFYFWPMWLFIGLKLAALNVNNLSSK